MSQPAAILGGARCATAVVPRRRILARPLIAPWGRGDMIRPASKLHDLGQSLWLDNVTRELLNSGTLQRYIDDLSVTGLTSNPTIFDDAVVVGLLPS